MQHKRAPRKELEACLGLLMWATSISPHLRCFTAPIYSDLHSPPGTCYPVPPRSWSQFLWCLDASCRVTKDASYLQLPLHAKVIEVKGKPVRAKTDIWPFPAADKTIWVRIADPSASEITLRNESKAAIHCMARPVLRLRICHAAGPPASSALPISRRRHGGRHHRRNWRMAVHILSHLVVCTAMGDQGAPHSLAVPHERCPAVNRLLRNRGTVGSAANGLRGHWLLLPQVLRRLAQRQ